MDIVLLISKVHTGLSPSWFLYEVELGKFHDRETPIFSKDYIINPAKFLVLTAIYLFLLSNFEWVLGV